jgi:two-component system, cell cycle sensor histidine kinase and response regulator CckA
MAASSRPDRIFPAIGVMGALCRTFDWTSTPLGPVEGWPVSLRTAAGMVIGSAFPGILLWGRDLVQIYNDGYIAVHGAKHPWALGRPTREVWPEVWELNEPLFRRALAGEQVSLREAPYSLARRGPDAPPDDVFVDLSFSPVLDETGAVGGVLVHLIDVTASVLTRQLQAERDAIHAAEREARRQLEEQAVALETTISSLREATDTLAESEQRYRLLFESNPQPMWVFDSETLRFLAVNEAALQQYGYTRDEMLALTLRDIRPAEDVPLLLSDLAHSLAGFEPASLWRHRRRDGSLLWVEVSAHTLTFDGRPARLILAHDVTGKVEVHQAITESERRLALALEGSSQGLWDWTVATGYCYRSPEFERLLGFDPGEIEPHIRTWEENTHPHDFPAALAAMTAHLEEGATAFTLEYRMRTRSGPWRWFQDRGMVVERDADGRAARVVGVVQDISERKHAEQEREQFLHAEREARHQLEEQAVELETTLDALQESVDAKRQSEARFRAIFDQAAVGISLVGRDGRTMAINPAFRAMLGYTDEALRQMTFLELMPAEALETAQARFAQLMAGSGTIEAQGTLLRVDGAPVPVHYSAAALTDTAGQTSAIVVVVRDVTEQKRAEDALRESEQRYRRFFEDDLTADYIARVDGTLLDCNQAFARIFGYRDVAEAIHSNVKALFSESTERDALVERIRRARMLELVEITLRRRDGRPVDVIGNLVGHFDAAGELVEIKGYLFDITERNALEAQLAQARKMEVVGRLAGGVAHDFNNMLAAIIGHAQILLDEERLDAGVREGLVEIRRAAERSAILTRQLLAFSRRQVLMPQEIDVNGIVTGMQGMLQRLIGEHIRVTTRLSPGILTVYVDPGQMEQVIMNLVVNARDAMATGGELTIATAAVELDGRAAASRDEELGPGRYAVLSITDTGSGMDPETLGRIFEPFFTTKPVGQGTGLGLSTVDGIVKQSDGSVSVESRPGGGSTFSVFLPLVARQAEPAGVPGTRAAASRGGETVLLVEDDTAVRALVRRVLATHGYTVLEAAGGAEALALVADGNGTIDLVLSDVVMPGMSGQTLARALATRLPGVPVILMSGYTEDAIEQHGVLAPGTHFVEKPFTPDELRRKVREVIDDGRAGPAGAR